VGSENNLLYGMVGWMMGNSLFGRTEIKVPTESYETIQNKKEENRLKEVELKLKEDELYLTKVKIFLDSVDIDCNREDLEITIYDEVEESKYFRMFIEECEKHFTVNSYEGRWALEKYAQFHTFLLNKKDKSDDQKIMMKAYLKFILQTIKHFGKAIGTTTDRYDYIMYLKLGPSYKAKYISQEELLKIIAEDKYGYSKHLMGI
jgi:hypothetical protein